MSDDETRRERLRENASGIAATTVTGVWLAALLAGFDWWLPFMLFGYVVVVPVVSLLFDEDEETVEVDTETGSVRVERGRSERDDRRSGDTADALERLRTRYAEGEISDEQFERKLDRLLETETPEDAAEYVERTRSSNRDREVERER